MNKYLKSLGITIIVLVFLVLSVYVVSANDNNNNNNNSSNISSNNNNNNNDNDNVNDNNDNNDNGDENGEDETTPTPTPVKESHYACVRNACVKVNGEGEDSCKTDANCQEATPTPTPTVTPTVTPTQTPNVGGPGDGRSDGRSDGLGCGSHGCNTTPASQGVLGASTGPQVLGLSTTSSDNNQALALTQIFAAFVLSATGFKFLKKNA